MSEENLPPSGCGDDVAAAVGASFKPNVVFTGRRRQFVCVDYPGIVSNLQKALDTFGGESGLTESYNDSNKRLELRWRLQDPYCKAMYGDSCATTNLMFKVKRRKKCPNNSDGEYEHKVEVLGTIKTTYRFQGMVDFQYLPMVRRQQLDGDTYESLLDNLVIRNMSDTKGWLQRKVPIFLPPVIFSRMDTPMEYIYRNEVKHRAEYINPQNFRPTHLIGSARQRRSHYTVFVNFDDPSVPCKPMAGAEAALRLKARNPEKEKELHQLFEERPIWSRSAIICNLDIRRDTLKYLLPLVAYYFITGPWRTLWVKYGYDPRLDRKAKMYQIIDFRFRQKGAADSLEIKAKRSTFSYKLPTVVSKQQSQVAKIQRSELDPVKVVPDSAAPPTGDEDRTATYKFRSTIMPPFRQMFYQLCDIEDEEVQSLVTSNNREETTCDEKDGWCSKDVNLRCREIMYRKLRVKQAKDWNKFRSRGGKERLLKKKNVSESPESSGSDMEFDDEANDGEDDIETEMINCA